MAILAVKYFIKDDASIIYGILRKCPFFEIPHYILINPKI